MATSRDSRKHWRNFFLLTLPITLLFVPLVASHLRHGEVLIHIQEPYNSRNAVIYLSRELLTHPLSESFNIQWPEVGGDRMVVRYRRADGKLFVSLDGALGPAFFYNDVTDSEIFKWLTMGVTMDSAKKLHNQHAM